MMTIQNEFILLVNAYYQADATSKNMIATSMFGKRSIQPELAQFREMLMQTSEKLGNMVLQSDQQGKSGQLDKILISAKLKERFGVSDSFILEIENSISKYRTANGDMNSYRISFQMGSDTIYNFLAETIPQFGIHVSLKEGVSGMIQDILHQNYWEGDEIKQQINFVRMLTTSFHFSDSWIKEYAFKMFQK
jgi:hypothetical protein